MCLADSTERSCEREPCKREPLQLTVLFEFYFDSLHTSYPFVPPPSSPSLRAFHWFRLVVRRPLHHNVLTMSAEDSGHVNPLPVEPIVQPPARARIDDDEREIVRLRFQLGERDDEVVAAADERQRLQETIDTLNDRVTALARQNQQSQRDMDIARRDLDQGARERARSRFSTVHTPFAPSRPAPQSTPFGLARAAAPSESVPKEFFRTTKLPTFSAVRKKDQISLHDWQYAFLNYCDATGLDTQTDAERCIVAASLAFAPEVSRWYRTEYIPSVKPSPITWDYFMQCITDKYEPVPVGFTARTALKSVRQHSTIEEYNAAFSEVVSLIPDMAEADKVDKYVAGLKKGLRIKVVGTLAKTLIESMTVAVQLEAAWATIKAEDTPPPLPPFVRRYPNRYVTTATPARGSEPAQNPPTPHLGRMSVADEYDDDDEKKHAPSHSLAAMQPTRSFPPKLTDALRAELQAQNKCFRCRQVGHVARQCKVYFDSKNE